jgi:hypothetical protein
LVQLNLKRRLPHPQTILSSCQVLGKAEPLKQYVNLMPQPVDSE